MKRLLSEIAECRVCDKYLSNGCRPVMQASSKSKILIIGQAPGLKVHESGIPWQDQSGVNLRMWMGIKEEQFYDTSLVGIVPMGFCYPGKGKSGDLPPRPECAPLWHPKLLNKMKNVQLTLLIGQYAQKYYLGDSIKRNLTETVMNFKSYLPDTLVLPHPSPRNRFWMSKNPWFEKELLPVLKQNIKLAIENI